MKPGDLIEWAHKDNGKTVDLQERLWSSSMRRWVPIGGVHLLVSVAEGGMTWLPVGCENRLFRARADDSWVPTPAHARALRRGRVNDSQTVDIAHFEDEVAPRAWMTLNTCHEHRDG